MARGTGAGGICGNSKPRGGEDALRARLRELAVHHDLDAYLVGGPVRDELSGKPFTDPDICVCGLSYEELAARLDEEGSISPLEITRVELDADGNKVGTPMLVGLRLYADWGPQDGIEFALARTEVSDGDGHKDFRVEPDPSVDIVTDLARRDFTVNAMARSLHTGELIDPYGGQADLAAGVLRTVSPTSFQEDPLRIMRALPRMAKDGLVPSAETVAQMREHTPLLRHVSAERIRKELEKTLMGAGAADTFRFAREIGLLQAEQVLPEFAVTIGYDQNNSFHSLPVDEHLLMVLQRACELDAPLSVRWAALLHDLGKPESAWVGKEGHAHYYRNPADPDSLSHEEIGARIARTVMKRFRQPDALARKVEFLVAEHMFRCTDDPIKVRRFLARVGRDNAAELLQLRRSDHGGKNGDGLSGDDLAAVEALEAQVAAQWTQPLTIGELAVSGREVVSFGFQGPAVGEQLRSALSRVVDNPDLNALDRQLAWLEKAAVKARLVSPEQALSLRESLTPTASAA